jgi:hypothetical protein
MPETEEVLKIIDLREDEENKLNTEATKTNNGKHDAEEFEV